MASELVKEMLNLQEENIKLTQELKELCEKQEKLDKQKDKAAHLLFSCAGCLNMHSTAKMKLEDLKTDDLPDQKKIIEFIKELDDEELAGFISLFMLTMMGDEAIIIKLGDFLHDFIK